MLYICGLKHWDMTIVGEVGLMSVRACTKGLSEKQVQNKQDLHGTAQGRRTEWQCKWPR